MRRSSLWRRSVSCRLSCPAQVSKAPLGLRKYNPNVCPNSELGTLLQHGVSGTWKVIVQYSAWLEFTLLSSWCLKSRISPSQRGIEFASHISLLLIRYLLFAAPHLICNPVCCRRFTDLQPHLHSHALFRG